MNDFPQFIETMMEITANFIWSDAGRYITMSIVLIALIRGVKELIVFGLDIDKFYRY